jgi:hypothetical protein
VTILGLIASTGVSAQATTNTSLNTMKGTVRTQQGQALSGICVEIFNDTDIFFQTSQADGTWTQPNMPDGTYVLEFFDCRQSDYPSWYLGNTPLQDQAQQVPISGGSTISNLDINMPPGGGISGTVTDAATGLPIENLRILIYWPQLFGGEQAIAGVACTDSTGHWRDIGESTTGAKVKYLGIIGCSPQSYSYQQQWYDGKSTFASATIVPISENIDTTGVNVKMTPPKGTFGGLAGHAFDGVSAQPIAGICVSVFDSATNGLLAESSPTKADGSYSMSVVPDGSSEIARFSSCKSSANYVTTWSGDTPFQSQATTFAVTNKQVTTVDAMVPPGATITGGVVNGFVTPHPAVPNVPVDVIYAHGPDGMADVAAFTVCTDSGGKFRVSGLPSGTPPTADLTIAVNVPGMVIAFSPGSTTTCSDTGGGSGIPYGWYQNRRSFAAADLFDLNAPGAVQHGVNVTLKAAAR